jgi:hypothetical protein
LHGASPNTGAEETLDDAKKALGDAYERAGDRGAIVLGWNRLCLQLME